MNGYSKMISTGGTTHHKLRSLDSYDSFPPQTSKSDQQEQEQPADNQSKIHHPIPVVEELGINGERFGVILGRSGSVSNSAASGFSMRRSSSVSERYCRIHDQYMAIASPLANIADDGTTTRSLNMKKKKLSSGDKILKACKRLLGL